MSPFYVALGTIQIVSKQLYSDKHDDSMIQIRFSGNQFIVDSVWFQ